LHDPPPQRIEKSTPGMLRQDLDARTSRPINASISDRIRGESPILTGSATSGISSARRARIAGARGPDNRSAATWIAHRPPPIATTERLSSSLPVRRNSGCPSTPAPSSSIRRRNTPAAARATPDRSGSTSTRTRSATTSIAIASLELDGGDAPMTSIHLATRGSVASPSRDHHDRAGLRRGCDAANCQRL